MLEFLYFVMHRDIFFTLFSIILPLFCVWEIYSKRRSLVSFRGQNVVDVKFYRYLLGFVMKISDGHPYHLHIGRTPRAKFMNPWTWKGLCTTNRIVWMGVDGPYLLQKFRRFPCCHKNHLFWHCLEFWGKKIVTKLSWLCTKSIYLNFSDTPYSIIPLILLNLQNISLRWLEAFTPHHRVQFGMLIWSYYMRLLFSGNHLRRHLPY